MSGGYESTCIAAGVSYLRDQSEVQLLMEGSTIAMRPGCHGLRTPFYCDQKVQLAHAMWVPPEPQTGWRLCLHASTHNWLLFRWVDLSTRLSGSSGACTASEPRLEGIAGTRLLSSQWRKVFQSRYTSSEVLFRSSYLIDAETLTTLDSELSCN